MQLGRAVKYLLEDEYFDPIVGSDINFRDYPDTVNFEILSEAFRAKYIEYNSYIDEKKRQLIEHFPDLLTIVYNSILKEITLVDKIDFDLLHKLNFMIHGSLPRYDKIAVLLDQKGEPQVNYSRTTEKYMREREFLIKYRDLFLELFSLEKTSNFFQQRGLIKIKTIDQNFQEVEISSGLSTRFWNNLTAHSNRRFVFSYILGETDNIGRYEVKSSFAYVNRLMSNQSKNGLQNKQTLASKILISESDIPEFFQEEVHRQKQLQLSKKN